MHCESRSDGESDLSYRASDCAPVCDGRDVGERLQKWNQAGLPQAWPNGMRKAKGTMGNVQARVYSDVEVSTSGAKKPAFTTQLSGCKGLFTTNWHTRSCVQQRNSNSMSQHILLQYIHCLCKRASQMCHSPLGSNLYPPDLVGGNVTVFWIIPDPLFTATNFSHPIEL